MNMIKATLEDQKYKIWQWGKCLYCGTKEDCEILKNRWTNQCGNIELEILPV
jgi:hypothetical protein